MNEYFVSAHGGRDAGTSTGTFVIPNDLEIHFYSADGTVLQNSLAVPLYCDLTRQTGYGRICSSYVKRIAGPYQVVPDYIAFGAEHQGADADPVFQGYPTGIYRAGRQAPSLPIPAGQQMRQSEIIYSRKPHLTGRLHWLFCRENMDPNRVVQPYRPSDVVAWGGAWRD
ncbi:MAG: putative adhesin [Candidatus Thiodiazotropha sp. 6PLUC4]